MAVVLWFAAVNAAAIPLAKYHQRLHDAQVGLTALMFSDKDTSAKRSAQFDETLRTIRETLPSDLVVEWNGGSVHVDLAWLDLALNRLEKIPPTDTQHNDLIVETTERLAALDARLDEVEKAEAANALSRDEAKARLAEILRRKEFDQEEAPKPVLNQLLERFVNWLGRLINNLFPQPQPLSAGPSALVGFVARILVIALAVALIGFVLWKFIPRLLRRNGRKKVKKREARVVLGETLEADQTSADLWSEAEGLARSGNIRAAIRKGYIALLCELGDRKIVGLAQHKTNRDYLHDVQERRALYQEMRQLTSSFEYHWYGYVPATEQDWNAFRSGYRQALTHG